MAQNKLIPPKGVDTTPPTERIAASLKRLTATSQELHSVGDELSEVIIAIEKSLKSANPCVTAWYTIAEHKWDGISFWHRDIGYAQIGKDWGIGLRTVNGFDGERDEVETWLFKDAPRWMQIESVGKLPDLVDELIKRTEETTAKLIAKIVEAQRLSEALSAAVSEQNESPW
jgi:hypothetical protein